MNPGISVSSRFSRSTETTKTLTVVSNQNPGEDTGGTRARKGPLPAPQSPEGNAVSAAETSLESQAPPVQRVRSARFRRSALLLIAVVLGFAVGAFTFSSTVRKDSSQGNASPASPRKGVVALGRLEPEGGIINVCAPLGEQIFLIKVKEGDNVRENDVLATLENHRVREAEKALADALLEEARQRREALKNSSEKLVQQAEQRIKQVENEVQFNIVTQEAKVGALKAQLQSVTVELERQKKASREIFSATQILQQELVVRQAEEEVAAALAQLGKLKKGQELEIIAARLQRDTARVDQERAQKEVPFSSLEKSQALASLQLTRTKVRAPCAGKVLKINTRPGEVVALSPVLQMANTTKMIAIAEVYETDRQQIQMNARAMIESPALARKLHGTVYFISQIVGPNRMLDINPVADADRRVLEVKILLDGPDTEDAAKYLNLQVTVTITQELADE